VHAIAIIVMVAITFENLLLTLSPRIFLLFAIFDTIIRTGTDTNPFMTAVYTKA
jgi:hypothetical protein